MQIYHMEIQRVYLYVNEQDFFSFLFFLPFSCGLWVKKKLVRCKIYGEIGIISEDKCDKKGHQHDHRKYNSRF